MESEVKVLDWILGRENRPMPKIDHALNASVEREIAMSIAERHQLEKKIVHHYPLIADILVPYKGEKSEES
jgi:hypothetical protein